MARSWASQSPAAAPSPSPAGVAPAWSPAAPPIVTPEAVVLDFERAGVASRTLAYALDLLALVVLLGLVALLAALLGVPISDQGAGGVVLAVVSSLLVVVAWFVGFESLWHGRTLGKAALGLRAVSVDGTTIRFQQSFVRAALGLVECISVPFVAVLSALLSPRDQRVGDMAAGTLVVRERSAQSEVAPVWFPPPYGYERYSASLDVSALDDDTYGLVRTYLLRLPTLRPAARDHLAVRLANPIATRMDHQPPAWLHPQLFLSCVAASWQRSHGGPAPPLPPVAGPPGYGPPPGYGWPPPPAAPPAPPPPPRPAPPPAAPPAPPPPPRPAPPPPPRPAPPPPPPGPHPG